MSTIFYSQVNRAVQQELIKRGSAGVSDRSTDAIRFMVEKIANVQLNAFEKKPSADITMNNNTIAGLGLLGGLSTIGKDLFSFPLKFIINYYATGCSSTYFFSFS
jgi:hypothetical protein